MGSSRPPGNGSGGNSAEDGAGEASGPHVIVLTPEELAILLRCCLKHRSTIPSYLLSAKAEFEAMNSIVRKLEASAEGRQ